MDFLVVVVVVVVVVAVVIAVDVVVLLSFIDEIVEIGFSYNQSK